MLASLFGEVRTGHVLSQSAGLETHVAPRTHDLQCAGGAGHVACQSLLAGQTASPTRKFAFVSPLFEIVPVRARSRLSSPQPPPPRDVA